MYNFQIIFSCYRPVLLSIRVSARLHLVKAEIAKISAAFPEGEGPEIVGNSERKVRNPSNSNPNAPCTRNLRSKTKGVLRSNPCQISLTLFISSTFSYFGIHKL